MSDTPEVHATPNVASGEVHDAAEVPLVERAAKAMFERSVEGATDEVLPWDEAHPDDRSEYVADARAALAALGFTADDVQHLRNAAREWETTSRPQGDDRLMSIADRIDAILTGMQEV